MCLMGYISIFLKNIVGGLTDLYYFKVYIISPSRFITYLIYLNRLWVKITVGRC